MSRQNINQNMQNGVPPQWGSQPSMTIPPQKNFNPHSLNNGLGSSQSSRDASPVARFTNIPASQLPPSRGHIPAGQLPPARPGVSPIMPPHPANSAGLAPTNLQGVTPLSSPRISTFTTSTPVSQPPNINGNRNDAVTSASGETVQSNSHPGSEPIKQVTTSSYSAPLQQPMNIKSSVASQNMPPAPTLTQTRFPPPNSVGQTSSTLQNMPPIRQNLNQQQNIQRPVSTGAQMPQNFEQKIQNQFSQSQNQLSQAAPVVSSNNQNQNQAGNVNYQNQNVVRPQMPPLIQNQFNSNPQLSNCPPVRPVNPPVAMNPSMPINAPANPNVSQYPTTPVSSLHSKRYPQPQAQQPMQQNYPNTNQQQPQQQNMYQQNANISNPFAPQQTGYTAPTNTYNQQQQPNTFYQQPQQPQQQQPQQQQYQQQNYQQRNYQQGLNQQMSNLSVAKAGFNKLWGAENFDLLQCPNVLPHEAIEPPKVRLGQEFLDNANCSPEIFRCTMTKIPESNSLLQKSRLPLGVLIHPFKDLNHLPVIQCSTIVRCRACRTYINPFIFFVDTKRWKCNLCYRVNELPEEFQYDPVSKSYGDPSRRPEIKSSTIEYIAPSEYMLRPPQPAVYLFLLDISRNAIESEYLHTICEVLSTQLATLPGDARTQIGFLAYNSTLHFFSLAEGLSQPHEMIVSDVDDIFLPCPDNLLVNLKEHMELVTDLLTQLPIRYQNSFDNGSALGAALQAAFKLMSSTGGRVTVFQSSLPTLGPGALTAREDPNQRAGKEAPHLNPATDFYKRLALDCSGHQVAVDLFVLNSQYVDVATLSGISRFSGGCMYHFPLFKASRIAQAESLERCFKRYLSRKIGFEAVMRIRCTRGLAIHTFHGNFFVRSTDLLSLPNVNPDAGFGMQVSIEESLSDLQSVCFQAALLYTSSKGERRIRVHTLCLPIVTTLSDVLNAADQQCIVGFLAKMAVDRSQQSSLSDARDAFINVAIDILSSYKLSLNMGTSSSGLLAPQSLKLLPLYILALLKFTAFRTGQSTRLDDRVFAMCDMKTLPLAHLLQLVYPDLYPIYRLGECPTIVDSEGGIIPQPPRLQLTSRNIDSHGAYLLDAGQQMIIYVCQNVSPAFLTHALGVPNFNSIPDPCYELPKINNPDNQRLHMFINCLNDEKPYTATLQIIRENSPNRTLLLERLIEDRIESALSYNEFLQHLKTQVK